MIAGSLVFNWRVQARTEFVNATKLFYLKSTCDQSFEIM